MPGKNNFTYSQNGLNLTEQFEGLRLDAYQDQVGVWTIGYGHTGPDVHPGLTITQEQANSLLMQDTQSAAAAVNRLVTVALNQDEFDALVDFVFNLGEGALAGSTLLKLLNAGNFAGAAGEFPKWCHAGGQVVPGLVRRRAAEQQLFEQGMQQAAPAPTSGAPFGVAPSKPAAPAPPKPTPAAAAPKPAPAKKAPVKAVAKKAPVKTAAKKTAIKRVAPKKAAPAKKKAAPKKAAKKVAAKKAPAKKAAPKKLAAKKKSKKK
jgi:lysozyme